MKDMGISDHLTCFLRNLYAGQEVTVRTRSNSWNNELVQNWEGICQGYKLSPCFFNVKSASYEMPGWMNHRLESRLLGEISMTSDMQMTSPLWQETERN